MTDYTDTIINWLGTFATYLPWLAAIFVVGIFVAVITVFILRLLDRHRLLRQKSVFLELTPPANVDKSLEATQRLFSVLHGLEAGRSLSDKLLGRKVVFSLEVYSAKDTGIPYVVRVAEHDVATFEQILASYLPDARCKRVDDFLLEKINGRKVRVLDIKQTGHFAYPLQSQGELEEHDAMAYLLGAMTKLDSGELIGVQVVVSPAKVRKARELSTRLLRNEEMLHTLGKRQSSVVGAVFNGINTVLFGILTSIGDVVSGPSRGSYRPGQAQLNHKQQAAMGIKPARTLSPLEQKLADAVQHKLNQPLFRVNIRVLIAVDDKQDEKQRIKGIKDWLALFNVPKYQALRVRFNTPLRGKRHVAAYTHRLPSLLNRNTALLAASELADLYHFPHNETTKTENVIKSFSKTLPAPVSLKNGTKLDVLLGRNHHLGSTTEIGVTTSEREKHMYVIGSTGSGKTTMMLYAIIQDIRNGKGVAVIDPHGDLANTILKYIPEERRKDVVYLNPVDIKHPVGLNFLELPTGLEEDDLLLEQGRVTSAVVSVMRKVFSDDDSNAHRIEAVMRNAIRTAFTVKDATLFTLLKLLRNEKFRKEVVSKLEDEDLKDFWQGEIGQAGDMQLVSMTRGVNHRLDRFNSSEPVKRVFGQVKSTINFEDIMDSGKILICNLAHGEIEEDESTLFGTTVLAKLKMAAERRARIPEKERRPFYVYVDEFQNFATTPFVKMLSSARKYKMFLTIAEQSTKQQEDDRLTEAILSNVGTVVCFRTGSYADEELMLHRFEGFLVKGEISNLSAYNFYIRIQAQESLEPMSGVTVVLPEEEASEATAKAVIKASRHAYATTYVKAAKPKPKEQGQSDKNTKNGSDEGKQKDKKPDDNDPLDANDDK